MNPQEADDDCCCCGGPAPQPSSPMDRAGYILLPCVEDFLDTPAGSVPRVATAWTREDRLRTALVRTGYGRNRYTVAPGLYAAGTPDAESPVLVTANFRLTFDILRRELHGRNVWILVLDTHGINVWCAAGKHTFGHEEIARRVRSCGLDKVVSHRTLVLPQLGAPGVDARAVRKLCGFEVVWGPIRAEDISVFLENGMQADEAMRSVTFTLGERAVLTPVEVWIVGKQFLWIALAVFLASGVGSHFFSLSAAWHRGLVGVAALAGGVLAGAVIGPILLPWLPGRALSVKGVWPGLVLSAGLIMLFAAHLGMLSATAVLLAVTAISSWLCMQFTGTTPYTSPTGVEFEMRRAMPWQILAAAVASICWIAAGFLA